MIPSDDPPKLPKWAFLLGDGTLLATAGWIAAKATHPTAGGALVGIVACVALAAVCGAIPFITEYGCQQEASLLERQRALSALAQTVETCAEQISIAAGSLQRFNELAASPAPPAGESVQPLRAQIAELQSQLLTGREGERGKLAQLEASVAATAAAVAGMGASLTAKIEGAAAHLEAKVAAIAGAVALVRTEAAAPTTAARTPADPIAKVVPFENPAPQVIAFTPAPAAPAPEAPELREAAPPEGGTPAPPAPPRPAVPPIKDAPAVAAGEINSAAADAPAAPPPRKRAPRKPPAAAPLPLESPVGVAPATEAAAPSDTVPRNPPPADPAPNNLAIPAASPRKTSFADPYPAEDSEPADAESALSADGATRLLVTAYIGIGNRLFVRGEGPGLTWERGVPLQFVSIGKWRWETTEASAPVIFRLYKNDEIECTALGRRSLAPGRQQEFQATF